MFIPKQNSQNLIKSAINSSIVTKPFDIKEVAKEVFGNRLSPPPISVTRWLLGDLEDAIFAADVGNMTNAAQLYRAMQKDGIIKGVLGIRTNGLVRLPVQFYGGNDEIRQILEGNEEKQSVFKQMFPVSELAKMAADGVVLGMSIGEMLDIEDLEHPKSPYNPQDVDNPEFILNQEPYYLPQVTKVLRRLDPQWLQYRWNEDRWYYNSLVGPLPIFPGDGRWILHLPGGKDQPWNHSLWHALGRTFIAKENSFYNRQNFSGHLANPARMVSTPQESTERQRGVALEALKAWGTNQIYVMPPGYEASILESNGTAHQIFDTEIESCNREMIIAIAGQLPSTIGSKGFGNGDIHENMRADLVQADGDALAETINLQGILPWINETFGGDAVQNAPSMCWDVTPPRDLKEDADSLTALAQGIQAMNLAGVPYKKVIDLDETAKFYNLKFKDADSIAPIPVQSPQDLNKLGTPPKEENPNA